MNNPTLSQGAAIVCDRNGAGAAIVGEYLRTQGVADTEWHLPRDVDEVDKALCAGRIQRVIFPALDDFLAALWDEPLTLDRWLAPEMRVEFAQPSGPSDAARAATLMASWQRYQALRRRTRAVAGLVLSAAAIAAAFVVLVLAR